jgi:hypothetical protein
MARLFIGQADLVSSLRSGFLWLMSRPMPGAKIFHSTRDILAGIELIHLICNGRLAVEVVMLCLVPTSLIRWQDKSAQCQVLEKTHLQNLLCAGECDGGDGGNVSACATIQRRNRLT